MKRRPYTSLQDWMERTGTHQAELARRAKMPRSVLSNVLKGSRRCSLDTALRLFHITGVPVQNMTAWPRVPVKRTLSSVA